MKKLLFYTIILSVLFLGACSKEDSKATSNEEPGKTTDVSGSKDSTSKKLEENELVYEINGEKKTIEVEKKYLSFTGTSIKVPETHKVEEDEEALSVLGINELEGSGFVIMLWDKPKPNSFYENIMYGFGEKIEKYESIDSKDLISKYDVALTTQNDLTKTIYLAKTNKNKPYDVKINLPLDKATPENEAKLLAILESYEY